MRKKLKEFSRRFVSVFLSISLLFVFVVSPVSAADYSLNLIDLYSLQETLTANYNSDRTLAYIDLKFPSYENFYYFEYYYYVNNPNFTPNIQIGDRQLGVTNINLGGGNYKSYYYGYTGGGSVRLNFYSTDSNPISFVLFEAKYSVVDYKPVSMPYSIVGYNGSGNTFSSSVSAGSVYDIPSNTLGGSNDVTQNFVSGFDFTIYIPASEWKKYDAINLRFDIRSTSLDSCIVRVGNRVVDSSLSLSNTSFDIPPLNHDTDSYVGRGYYMSHYILDIDLDDVPLALNDSIAIHVTGTYPWGDQYSSVMGHIYFCSGLYVNDPQDSLLLWLRRINSNVRTWFATNLEWLTVISSKLDNILTGGVQNQVESDSFNDTINDQANELEDLTADLNSVTRPPLSDVNLSTSGMVDQSVVVLATNGIGSILSNQIILRVLIMSLTFALAGFILFGKR